ncbi:MAG TPA: hypothetical protein VGL91_25275 [Acidobacteriota bacterium]
MTHWKDRRQTAGGRRQEADGRRQEAGGRKQEAGSRRQMAGIVSFVIHHSLSFVACHYHEVLFGHLVLR